MKQKNNKKFRKAKEKFREAKVFFYFSLIVTIFSLISAFIYAPQKIIDLFVFVLIGTTLGLNREKMRWLKNEKK